MKAGKENGILLHLSSLPGKYGIGSMGKEARAFVDFLAASGVDAWQILPVGQTSFGDSPYQSPSAFAGNPYFIDLETLVEDGLLKNGEIEEHKTGEADYEWLWNTRYEILEKAFARFEADSDYEKFVEEADWLDGYALFMAIKKSQNFMAREFWPKELSLRKNLSERDVKSFEKQADFWRFLQYEFFKQYYDLKAYAEKKGVKIVGDMPIYVAMDSAEVWETPELFLFDADGKPTEVAGVPPDAFSADGQLWGNPLYDWVYHKRTNFKWWKKRLEQNLKMFDVVRIDHFRAFESYFCIPADSDTAKCGKWREGPMLAPFENIETDGRIIAEDLGIITDDVRALLKKSGFPGMKVLQFAFAGGTKGEYLPENFETDNSVVYTGTHDNDTTNGWFKTATDKEKQLFSKLTGYFDDDLPLMKMILGKNAVYKTPAEAMIELAMKSRANLAVVPLQDYLNLGSEGRMNHPSESGWWKWRAKSSDFNEKLSEKIKRFAEMRKLKKTVELSAEDQGENERT